MGADLFQQLLSQQTQREPATSRHIFLFFASCPVLQEMTWQVLGKVMLTFHGSKKKYSNIM